MNSYTIFRNERTNWTNKVFDLVLPEREEEYEVGKVYQIYTSTWIKPIKKYRGNFYRVLKGSTKKMVQRMPSKSNYKEDRCFIY